jgi:thiol-disulfide isomerase/thioredoxin
MFQGFAAEISQPELSLKDTMGRRQSLKAYRGRVVVLNFWATCCGPCKEEMPMLQALDAFRERSKALLTEMAPNSWNRVGTSQQNQVEPGPLTGFCCEAPPFD